MHETKPDRTQESPIAEMRIVARFTHESFRLSVPRNNNKIDCVFWTPTISPHTYTNTTL